jgi:hypothetical protein
MKTLTGIVLILFLLNSAGILLASVLWRNKDTGFSSFVAAGSLIYRDLPRFIRKEKVTAYLALSYSAVILFMLTIVSMILFGPPI